MAPRFTSNPQLEEMPGFNRVEVSLIEDDNKDTEEMNVTTWWDSEKTLKTGKIVMHLNKHINALIKTHHNQTKRKNRLSLAVIL